MSNLNESPKQPRRRRSTSLDSKVIIKYRENNICQNKIPEKQMKKYASSSSLFNPENVEADKIPNSPRLKPRSYLDYNCYFLFVNWLKDFKSVKALLMSLHDPNIFKTEFPRHNDLNLKEFYPPLVFFVTNNLKIDNEYEAYLINDYDIRLKELLELSETGKEIRAEYSHGLELIDKQVAEFEQLAAKDDNEKFPDKTSNQRRHSETMALIIQNKNQPMQTFLPREHQGLLNVIRFTCEFEMIYTTQDKKLEKNYKPFLRVGVLSNIDINIYTRNNMKLKDSYVLRHLYVGQCNDTQIANIDSCLRIGGPFGNDMIIRFPNPQTRNEWNKYINEQTNAYQESIKNNTTTITIFNDTNPPSSVPLVSKTITINGNTLGLGLKKIAMGIFEIKDADINDLSIIFLIKNKENLLHDDVSLMVLQEHVNNIQENNCAKSCMDCDKLTAIVKIIYYLRSSKPLTDYFTKDGSKNKKIINTKSKEEIKIKQNKYSISSRWTENEIPNWLMNLLSDLYNEGAKCEGIFRISGVVLQSDDYINQICETDDLKIEASINTKASILKKFISIIDGSLLTSINKDQFIILSNEINSVEEFLVQEDQQSKLLGLIQKIPLNNYHLFQHILVVLNHIIENSQVNQMNITNLSTCFSQNLFKHLSDDAVKINKVFECILHLINRIVNAPTYHNIVMAYETKLVPIGSGETHHKSDALLSVDLDSNSPRTTSDSADENHNFVIDNDKPLVPPRRKRGIIRSNTKYTSSTSIDPAMRKMNANKNEKRQSLCDEMIPSEITTDSTDFKSKMLQTIDSSYLKKTNVISKDLSKERKISRGRSTLMNNLAQENQSTNFQRQTQVSRKHLKNNPNSDNASLTQNNANSNVNQIKSVSKLSRNTDRVIPKMRSRSQTKFGEPSPTKSSHVSRQPSSVTNRINTDSSSDLNNSRDSKERKRSNSACRVTQLKEQYEANPLTTKPPLPLKKNSLHPENRNVSKIVKEFEENKTFRPKDIRTNRSRNVNGPIRPYHHFPSVIAQNELPQQPSSSFFDQLNDSNDEDVTYI